MTLTDVQIMVFRQNDPDNIVANPDFAIFKKWLADKAGTPLRGYAQGQEVALEDGRTAQVYTSGQVAVWDGKEVVVV